MASLDNADVPPEEAPRKRVAYRVGLFAAVAAVGLAFVLAPLAVVSVISALRGTVVGRSYTLMQPKNLHGEWTKLNLSAFKLDESARSVTLRVSGFHNCPAGNCGLRERVQFFSVQAVPTGAIGPPPSQTLDLPTNSGEVNREITLPVDGNLTDYPFDHYTLLLGVAFSHLGPGGRAVPFNSQSARGGLAYTVEDAVPRVRMDTPRILRPTEYDRTGVVYDSVVSLGFSRPLYLRVLNIDLILLIVISAIYGVIFRPFNQIIPTVGGLVLGVWGVRSLLVGSYPPDSTGVDLVLETAILFVLLVVGTRSIQYMWSNAGLGARASQAASADSDGITETGGEDGHDSHDPTE